MPWKSVGTTILTLFVFSSLSKAPQASAQGLEPCVDVALVLAVDGSDSVDAREYLFQQRAIAKSFRDPDVLAALRGAGTVSVAIVFWGDAVRPVHDTAAVTIHDSGDADRLARSVESLPRQTHGNTGLGAGLSAALDKLATMGCAHRSIINLSGDGKETIIPRRRQSAARPEQARDRARSMNVVINALAISGAELGLADYYSKKVITGPGAFVMKLEDYADYADALKRKLIREITPDFVSQAD